MKIDPYYQQQICNPMTLVSKNIRHMRIFAEVPLGGGHQITVGLSTTVILAISAATSLETLELRLAILSGDMLPLVGQ